MKLRRDLPITWWILVGCMSPWLGCASDAAEGSAGDDGPPGAPRGGSAPANPGGSSGASGGGGGGLPPEQETESRFELPVLSGRFLWSANPDSGRVALVDTRSRDVELVQAGFAPTYLAALPAADSASSAAVVLNARSDDASVLRLTADGVRAAAPLPTHAAANAWAVSPSGRWAIAWTDAAAIPNPDRADSFQELTVIDTVALRATRLSAGYRPSRLFIQADESRAFVVSEAGLTIVELSGADPRVSRDLALSEDPSTPALDVSVLPDGSFVLFRREGSRQLGIVDLASGTDKSVSLSGPITDLDLVAGGSSAIVVVRGQPVVPGSGAERGAAGSSGGAGGEGAEEAGAAGALTNPGGAGGAVVTPPAARFGASEVALFDVAEIVDDPTRMTRLAVSDLVGSVAVSSSGSSAVLYTNAIDLERVIVLPTDPRAANYLVPRAVGVRAAVAAVFVAPGGEHALVALRPPQPSAVAGAFAVVPLTAALPAKVQAAAAPITGVAFAPAPSSSAIATSKAASTAYLVHLPSLLVDTVRLPSLPLAAGIVPEENLGFVAQQHPSGRLSLLDLTTAEVRTLTGFELASGVHDDEGSA